MDAMGSAGWLVASGRTVGCEGLPGERPHTYGPAHLTWKYE
jgi:hypothetical protein